MNLIDLFPRTIGATKLATLTPGLIARAIELVETAEKVDLGADGAYTTDQNLLDHELFTDVKREVITLCKKLSESYSHVVEEIAICNSWGNVLAHGQSIRNHKHNNSYISGSFYLTGGSSLNITNSEFHDLFGLMPRVKTGNYRSWESFCINPEPGGVVVFPSGLYHSVSPSRDQGKRYSVAFNAVPVGAIGRPTSQLDLRIR